MDNAISLNEQNFEEEVLKSPVKVAVDFYSPKCPPCQMMAPIVDALAEELRTKVKIVKIDALKNQSLAEKYKVNSVPTFILFENGKISKIKTGVMPPAQFKNWLTINH